MKNEFYRPEKISIGEFREIAEMQKKAIERLNSGKAEKKEVLEYVAASFEKAEDLRGDGRLFWNLADPAGMDHDAYIEFVIHPTVRETAFIIRAFLLYPQELCETEGFMEKFGRCLRNLAECAFETHGCDGPGDAKEAFEALESAHTKTFVTVFSDICPEFTEEYNKAYAFFTGKEAESAMPERAVFVYGTLMRGQYNHEFLESSEFLCRGTLRDYKKTDLGYYPGIKEYPGGTVAGELYVVKDETMPSLDRLEGEGSLYRRTKCKVSVAEGVEARAEVYVYIPEIPDGEGKKRRLYFAYGSNMNRKQMLKERCKGAETVGLAVLYGYELLFRSNGAGTEHYGTVEPREGSKVYGTLYLISKENEKTLDEKEGVGNRTYYKKTVRVGLNGVMFEAMTYIKTRGAYGAPSENYKNKIADGYRAEFLDLNLLENAIVRSMEKSGA